jgi:hypothetical protein
MAALQARGVDAAPPSTAFGGPPPPLRGGGTGRGLRDHFQNAVEALVFEDILRRETQHSDAMLCKPSVTALIVPNALLKIVRASIDLYGESGRRAVEIQDVGTDGMLAAKPKSF